MFIKKKSMSTISGSSPVTVKMALTMKIFAKVVRILEDPGAQVKTVRNPELLCRGPSCSVPNTSRR